MASDTPSAERAGAAESDAAVRQLADRLLTSECAAAKTAATVDLILRQVVERLLHLEKSQRELALALEPRAASQSLADAAAGGQGWRARLYTPTLLTKLADFYFLVDCWHHRVLWNLRCDPDIESWQTLDESLAGPHSVASDGVNFVTEDTGAHRLRIYQYRAGQFQLVNLVDNLGRRPHRVRFDAASGRFYAIAGDLYALTLTPQGEVRRLDRIPLPFLEGSYTRSFTFHDGNCYFVSGNGFIHQTVLRAGAAEVRKKFAVPERASSMNDLWFGPRGVWVTASPQTIFEAASLEALDRGDYADRYAELGFRGTPYYIAELEGDWVIPEITEHSGVLRFQPQADGSLRPLGRLIDFGPPTADSTARYAAFPK